MTRRTSLDVVVELNDSDPFVGDCGCDDDLGCPSCEPSQWTLAGVVAQ